MEKHRASWKAELWLRRKIHSPDKFQDPKRMPRTGDSQGSRSLQRASSDVVRPLNRQVKILDNDASVTLKLEKTKEAISKQSSQRNNHKDKAHKKGQHGWLKNLMNILTRTESEESREKEEKKPKEKCISPQDPKYLEASVDPPEPTFRKGERGDKKSKEKCLFPQSPESLEVPTKPPDVTSKKKHKEKGDQKLKDKCILPQDPESLSTEPSEVISKKKDKERRDKKSKEKCIFPQSPEALEVPTEPPEVTSKKKHKEKGDKKSKEKCIFPQGLEPLEALAEPPEATSKKKDKTKKGKKSKEKCVFPQCPELLEALEEPSEPISRKKDKKSNLKKAFSFKKHSNEETKKSSGLDSRSPEARRPTKPTFLPLCISYSPASLSSLDSDEVKVHETMFTEDRTLDSTGLPNQDGQPPPTDQWPSNRGSESNDSIQTLAAFLREEGDKQNEKIKDLNFNVDWKSFSFTSLQTLADVFGNQEENQEPTGSQIEIRYHLLNRYAGNTNHAVHRVMGWRDHTVTHTFGHISYNNQQQGASTPFLSPD